MIRLLTKEDVEPYWALRLQALKDYPESFVNSYEEAKEKELSEIKKSFPEESTSFIMGAFLDGELVGIVGFNQRKPLKVNHKGDIWGMYVAPIARGNGTGKKLLQRAIKQAKQIEELTQIYLVVAADNQQAKALYEKLGFERYGYEKNALKINNQFIDEEHMMLVISNVSNS
ncbi:GNAT family N-acetyltransferase [Metabacillus iocasae]|uniref:RimJ/RimL family protein N-acetyltransferase n=1 Tax=Priestia iocasae TaxID=2291674 RepID=A0ABS2QUN0_9BACI|nr:GNAT family N-acetyltransferase [Metabacillus iocasae]MBM7703142.1 RimJ/RimL family protein N-acetyltransferase [Metabacillus iocasae]